MLGKALLSLLALSVVNATLAQTSEAGIEKRDTTLEIKLTGTNDIVLSNEDTEYSERCAIGRCPRPGYPHRPGRPGGDWIAEAATETLNEPEFVESASCIKKGARTCCNLGKWGWKCYLTADTADEVEVSELDLVAITRPACYKRRDEICCPDSTGKYVCKKIGHDASVSTMGPCWTWNAEWCCKSYKGRVDCSRHPPLSVSEALDTVVSNTELEADTIGNCWNQGSQWCCKYQKGRVDCSHPCPGRGWCGKVTQVLETLTEDVEIQGQEDEIRPQDCWNHGNQWCCRYPKKRIDCSSPCPGQPWKCRGWAAAQLA